MSKWDDWYQKLISELANRVDHDFTESEEYWSAETKLAVDHICNTFKYKSYTKIINDLTKAKHHATEVQRVEDEVKYANLNEYGELLPPAGEKS